MWYFQELGSATVPCITVLGMLQPPEVKEISTKVLPLALGIVIQLTGLFPVISRQEQCFLLAEGKTISHAPCNQ
jgi:hypothetical protein